MQKIALDLAPEQILNDPLINKGSAFTQKERDELKLNGHLPCHISTIEEQVRRRYSNFCAQPDALSRALFLKSLQNRNEILFFRLISEHLQEMLPYIYTPMVGELSSKYSALSTEHRGLYLSYPLEDQIDQILQSLAKDEVDVIVATDGERILGLGDLGVGGMAISVGKLALYTLFGGIHPARTLPVLLDVGTNNQELLKDPLYLGWSHPRISGKEYDRFIDRFVKAVKKRYPNALLQWEDFARPHARPLLERYRKEILSFNDDIQGTAAVVLAGLWSAVKLKGERLSQQKIVIFGGGSAGMGIAHQLLLAMKQEGMSEAEALMNFSIFDIEGVLHEGMTHLTAEQRKFAHKSNSIKDLSQLIDRIQPNILIGVSAQRGAFTEEIVKKMAAYEKRPIIFPLSNPTEKSEADPQDLFNWTEGRVIVATGSPFPPVTFRGKKIAVAQCNNVYIFPGVGLGAIVSRAKVVSDQMFLEAAHTLSEESPILKDETGSLFPSFEALRRVSRKIALRVACCVEKGAHMEERIDSIMWNAEYPTYFFKRT